MARGWESKSVEEQQSEAQKQPTDGKKRQLSPEEAKRMQRRKSLELAKLNVKHQLENATNDRHRQLLEEELVYLDREIAATAS